MTDGYDHWPVDSAERLDVRWYRIRMHGRDWLVDYSDPRDLRLYMPDLFPNAVNRHRIWDWGSLPESIRTRHGEPVGSSPASIGLSAGVVRWLTILLLLYLWSAPARFNLAYLTALPWIGEHWYIVIPVTISCFVAGILIFSACCRSGIDPGRPADIVMTRIDGSTGASSARLACGRLIRLLVFPAVMVLVGVFGVLVHGPNLLSFVLFLVLPLLTLVSDRFIVFSPLLLGWTYRIGSAQRDDDRSRG